jgi:hypothetical protein
MTEEEWLACTDPVGLLSYDELSATERKLRLFAVACCRRISTIASHGDLHQAIDTAERFADGLASDAEIDAACGAADAVGDGAGNTANYEGERGADEQTVRKLSALSCAGWAAYGATSTGHRFRIEIVRLPRLTAKAVALAFAVKESRPIGNEAEAERVIQTLLFRDIFENPFRLTSFNPVWRTDTALSLASQMYESRNFGAMPILADALQDAGCEDEQILSHCRDANQPHVRGCWVVDLVLGKE